MNCSTFLNIYIGKFGFLSLLDVKSSKFLSDFSSYYSGFMLTHFFKQNAAIDLLNDFLKRLFEMPLQWFSFMSRYFVVAKQASQLF